MVLAPAGHRSDRGFTLVELMTIVTILGILIAIAVPVYRNARTDATEAVLAENARVVSTQVQLLIQDGYSTVYRNWRNGDPQVNISRRLQADLEDSEAGTVFSDPLTNPVSGLDTVECRWGINWARPERRPPAVFITSGAIYEYDRVRAEPEMLAGSIIVAWDERDRSIDIYWMDSEGRPSETVYRQAWSPQ